MSICFTEHWVLDCGPGSGCMMWEGEDGQVFYWSCSSAHVVTARKKVPDGQRLISDFSQRFTLCYNDVDSSEIADTVVDLTGRSVVVRPGQDLQKRSLCQTGTLYELLEASGLALED
ncbi:hypothetical protein ACFOKI_04115 [Sphingomonas qilianensis]|uniref:Uncharacterized protein n=1 Tax=Sphingomonas qilianensis TaxID=1736690 RepID=A0ABU9XU69_9SPHN